MPLSRSPFKYRMLNAPTTELIDYAHNLGMNWVVAETSGHKDTEFPFEDPPVYMPGLKRLYPIRKRMSRAIEKERRRLHRLFTYAKKKGLKVIYHTYEVSVPKGFERAYPRMFSPAIREFRGRATAEQRSRQLCVSRAQVREVIAQKIQEVCQTFPELDGFAYTNNESSTQTHCWHRCEDCRNITFSRMMKFLHDAILEGIRRSGRPVRLFVRCWGTHETDFKYWEAFKKRVQYGAHELAGKEWLPAHVKAFAPKHLHFKPSRDILPFVRSLKGQDTAFIYKASWGDNNLHHPLNPWIGKYAPHDQVCEISFEHHHYPERAFYIMGREMQRRVRLCAARGVGICALTSSWGHHQSKSYRVHPSRQLLGELNLYLLGELMKNPEANLERVTARYLRGRYGKKVAAEKELVGFLLDSEDIAAQAMNVKGVRTTSDAERIPTGFHNFFGSIVRYAAMYPHWEKRLWPSQGNIKRIFRDKERNVKRAEQIVQRIEALKKNLPARAYQEFSTCFGWLLTMARSFRAAHMLFYTMWALREGELQPTTHKLDRLHEIIKEYSEILPLNRVEQVWTRV
ncbi:MAG: hypothetical protein AMS15_04695 [Planctomycetes bacterium DG_23]|nr:MAG: hypothetical protein AMS15_04695 [Planctomycetes bacterium DG_23]